ncbi:NADH-quinone oxidoreductase subunit E [Actinorhabdospora filicis]|uniref:NADH-quinone oxidoreductase subunit E n=1 Tax=Actinorhabdospora filicis TaxID=1785913 RepID=A0A9W6WDD7_9ACTN|nr:NADH-quinone oxidoreductase subunit E [Actinorhabdospora filicis]
MLDNEELKAQAREIIARYPDGKSRSALLPMLHLVQAEDGYVSPQGIAFCAEMLGISKAEVNGVATFYTMYKRKPTGDFLVSVCTNTMCDVMGGQIVYDVLSEYLEVGHDETTADGKITLEHAECLAACDNAPVMTVNYEFYDKVEPDTALGVVRELQDGRLPQPTRGARLCTLKQISKQLAGWSEDRKDALADTGVGEATLVGLRLAEKHGIAAPVGDIDATSPIRVEKK